MNAPSNETLDYKIQSMQEQHKADNEMIMKKLDSIDKKVAELPKSFVTRLEFKAVSAVIATIAVLIGIIWFFVW